MRIRPAVAADIAALEALIRRSAHDLSDGFYQPAERDAAIAQVFGVDTALVDDGTYLLAEDEGGRLLGCGGWSRRRTLFGGDRFAGREEGLLDPETDAAKIRAFFVAPEAARHGVASRLLAACTQAAIEAGFGALELMATLPGVPFYAARGFVAGDEIRLDLSGVSVAFVPMHRFVAEAQQEQHFSAQSRNV